MSAEPGVVVGIVDDIKDPEKLARVRVRLPHLNDQQTYWARLATLMAGPERGSLFRPEVGDEVLVAFAHGDDHQPYVLGAVWSREDKPPPEDGTEDNNWRYLKSRSGHVVKLNDKQGGETIEIVDKSGSNSIVIDTAQNTITVAATTVVKVEAQTVEVTGQSQVKVAAPTIEIKAQGSMTVESGGSLTIKGAIVQIN